MVKVMLSPDLIDIIMRQMEKNTICIQGASPVGWQTVKDMTVGYMRNGVRILTGDNEALLADAILIEKDLNVYVT